MKIGVIGAGYVGQVIAACLAQKGHSVTTFEIDEEKVQSLTEGTPKIHEENLADTLCQNLGRLTFTTNPEDLKGNEAIFLCVGTPPRSDGTVNLDYIKAATETIAPLLTDQPVIIKSTVPPGTHQTIKDTLRRHGSQSPVYNNPEFLREGTAVQDFLNPDRIVIGGPQKQLDTIKQIYKDFDAPIHTTNNAGAELIKYASNALLATKISFINELSRLAEHIDADIDDVAHAIGQDSRINPRFLQAGAGYGGSCFPKDVQGIIKHAEQHNEELHLLKAVETVNQQQKTRGVKKIHRALTDLKAKKIAVLGTSFKPGTDDTRGSPAHDTIDYLLKHGADIHVYDPQALQNTKQKYGDQLTYHKNPGTAVENAAACLALTAWPQIKNLNFTKIRFDGILYDGRNMYEDMPKNIQVIPVGKPSNTTTNTKTI